MADFMGDGDVSLLPNFIQAEVLQIIDCRCPLQLRKPIP
jgi:hypothetical protein